jgi:hypothetical protein
MSNVQPQGESLKKAIQWISDERRKSPDTPAAKLANDAALQFDLSPKDSDFLLRFVKQENQE